MRPTWCPSWSMSESYTVLYSRWQELASCQLYVPPVSLIPAAIAFCIRAPSIVWNSLSDWRNLLVFFTVRTCWNLLHHSAWWMMSSRHVAIMALSAYGSSRSDNCDMDWFRIKKLLSEPRRAALVRSSRGKNNFLVEDVNVQDDFMDN